MLSSRLHSEEVLIAAAQSNGYSGVSTLCFLAWDTVIHLTDEVDLIWSGPNTWVKFMYIIIRYLPILVQSSLLPITTGITTQIQFSQWACRTWLFYEQAAVETIVLAVEIVLIIRVYALYNSSQVVLLALLALYLAEIAVMITSVVLSVPGMQFNAQCLITTVPGIFMAYWLSSLAFETVLFGLTLISLFAYIRSGLKRQTVLYVFMRDGTWAFALIFVAMLLNTLMYKLNDTPLAGICFFWAFSVTSFAGAHVLLNLRRLTVPPVGQSTSTGSAVTTGITFVNPNQSQYPVSSAHVDMLHPETRTEAIALEE